MENRASVHKKTSTASRHGQNVHPATSTHSMSLSGAGTVAYPPNIPPSSTKSVSRLNVAMYSRHFSETKQTFASTVGGERPKHEPKAGRDVDLPGISLCDSDTKSEKGTVFYDSKNGKLSISVCFEVHGITHPKCIQASFDCDICDYLKWKYVTNSASQVYKLNDHLKSKYADKFPTEHYKKTHLLSSLEGNVHLQKGSLVIGFFVSNKEHARQIAESILKFVSNDQELVVETYDLNKSLLEKAKEKVKRLHDMKDVCVETINCKLYVVFHASRKEHVSRVLSEFEVYIYKRLKEKEIQLNMVLSKFTETIKSSLSHSVPSVTIAFRENDESFVCVLNGPEEAVLDAEKLLSCLENDLKKTTVAFTTATNVALKELFVENEVNDRLKKQHMECVAEQQGNKLIVYGFDEMKLNKACLFVSEIIVESEPVPLVGRIRENGKTIESYFRKTYNDKIVVSIDSSCRLNFVGLEDAVKEARAELVELNAGSISLPSCNSNTKFEEEVIDYYPISRKEHSRFMEKSDTLKNIAKEMRVTISVQQKQYRVEINGSREAVKRAYDSIELIEKSICDDTVVVSKQQAVSFFKAESSNQFLASIESSCDVLLEKEITYTTDEIEVTKQLHDENILWIDSDDRKLVLEKNAFDQVQASIKVKPVPSNQTGRASLKQGNTVLMEVPNRIPGKQSETPYLESAVSVLLTKASEDKEKCVALPLEPVGNWTFDDCMKCYVNSSVHWLLNRSNDRPSSVLLFTDVQDNFNRTDACIEEHMLDMLKEGQTGSRQHQIRLVSGHLDKTEADVLVNTTAPDLDLSYGRVSSALLKAAGHGIQQECKRNHPKGISPDYVAVTSGYKLKCQQVFHITLPVFDKSMTMESIENIRKAMLLCLQTASASNHGTIAFPAIGTGILGYPPDIVVCEMFVSVERFRREFPGTTLKEVKFVIFPKDVELCKKFEKVLEKTKKGTYLAQANCLQKCTVKIRIYGMRNNVSNAKAKIEKKANDMVLTADDVVTEVLPKVTITVFTAVMELHRKEFEHLTDGIKIEHNESKNEIELRGNRGTVQTALLAVRQYLRKVQEMQRCEVRVRNSNEKTVRKVLKHGFRGQENVCCVYNSQVPSITVFANSKGDLDKVVKELQVKLGCSTTDHTIPKEFEDSALCQRDGQEIDTSENGQMSHETGEAWQKQNVRRKFSWSQDATDIDVYERGNLVIRVYRANILHIPVEAIVNAANQDLNHCGGVARAIAKAAGETLLRECETARRDNNGPLPVASVVCTTAGNLSYKCVIHAVGPCLSDYTRHTQAGSNQCFEDLKQTVVNCFLKADQSKLASIGMPAIGSGVFKVPKEICAVQYANAILEFSGRHKTLCEIHIVDNKPDMIDVIHKTFSAMIREGKPSPFPLNIYKNISATTETDADNEDTRMSQNKSLKRTGRNRPKLGNHQTNVTTYTSDKSTLVCSDGDGMVPQKDSSKLDEGMHHATVAVEEDCVICMDKVTQAEKLRCGHVFCKECIDGYFRIKKVCPTCGQVCGIITGDQPDGRMDIVKRPQHISGYEKFKSIVITYYFNNGKQGPDHPRPGTPYKGITRTAYLPDNMEGREICTMLKVAFERRLVFTIGTSRTTGQEGVITWNDIHHKTDPRPNTQFGYPDQTYLQRVREELEVKGVTVQDIDKQLMKELEKNTFRKTFYN